jgi:hypothetical protein
MTFEYATSLGIGGIIGILIAIYMKLIDIHHELKYGGK